MRSHDRRARTGMDEGVFMRAPSDMYDEDAMTTDIRFKTDPMCASTHPVKQLGLRRVGQ